MLRSRASRKVLVRTVPDTARAQLVGQRHVGSQSAGIHSIGRIRHAGVLVLDHPSLEADEQGWRFHLEDRQLTMIGINFQTRLRFGPAEFVIESAFDLDVAGVKYRLEPDQRAGLGRLLAIYPDSVSDAAVNGDGVLRPAFVSGATVTVEPDPQYEAWSFVGPGGCEVICLPGGQLSIRT